MPKELSTGLVIAGAYADKLRRTLFAQLRDLVKENREFAREIARASGEINRLIYFVLVEKLKADKGDVVRIRVQYDVEDGRIKWYYDTLKLEYFKRVPDEEISKVVKETIEEKLAEVQQQYATAPTQEEAEALMEGRAEKAEERPPREAIEKPAELEGVIAEAAPIGETMEGGVVFEVKNSSGENIGVASIEERGGVYVAEAVILPKPGEAFKIYTKLSRSIDDYKSDPKLLVEELLKARPVKISVDEARSLLRSKMETLV